MLTFCNSYILWLLRCVQISLVTVTFCGVNVVWCYVLSQYPKNCCFRLCLFAFFRADPDLGCFVDSDSSRFDDPDSGCFDEPDSGCFDDPDSGCFDDPDSGCFDDPNSGCYEYDDPNSGRYEYDDPNSGCLYDPDSCCFVYPDSVLIFLFWNVRYRAAKKLPRPGIEPGTFRSSV